MSVSIPFITEVLYMSFLFFFFFIFIFFFWIGWFELDLAYSVLSGSTYSWRLRLMYSEVTGLGSNVVKLSSQSCALRYRGGAGSALLTPTHSAL